MLGTVVINTCTTYSIELKSSLCSRTRYLGASLRTVERFSMVSTDIVYSLYPLSTNRIIYLHHSILPPHMGCGMEWYNCYASLYITKHLSKRILLDADLVSNNDDLCLAASCSSHTSPNAYGSSAILTNEELDNSVKINNYALRSDIGHWEKTSNLHLAIASNRLNLPSRKSHHSPVAFLLKVSCLKPQHCLRPDLAYLPQ